MRALALEPEAVDRILAEVDLLAQRMDYENRDPMEQVMIEQVLTAHTQNLVAMYQLENLPVNTHNSRQNKYLTERVRSTHYRLCRSMAMLTALRMVGPRLNPGRKFGKEVVPKENVHRIWPNDQKELRWQDIEDPRARTEAMQHNEDIRKWMNLRDLHPEVYADDPPHLFIEVVREAVPLPQAN